MIKPSQPSREFDAYADNYAGLLRDPMRERFASDQQFFHVRKMQVIKKFMRARGLDIRELAWLDIGCGQGALLRQGAADFKTAIGCDPSEQMLAACDGLEVRHQPSLNRLPFDDATFDFATAVCVYHHVPPEARASFTKEALRILKPGGIFCIMEHNPLNPITRMIVSRAPVDADAILLTARETRRLLSAGGSRILSSRNFL